MTRDENIYQAVCRIEGHSYGEFNQLLACVKCGGALDEVPAKPKAIVLAQSHVRVSGVDHDGVTLEVNGETVRLAAGDSLEVDVTLPATDAERFRAKQKMAAPARFYGNGGTIHTGGDLDVETDTDGNVVAVWFRCQPLPFKQQFVERTRALEMERMYERDGAPVLTGVEVLDRKVR